ncbi:MAG: VCBS repeat-containing protein [Planctomycetota bacterium]|nr:VCBS repeat-containing protein [Planctomycetota bacterium]
MSKTAGRLPGAAFAAFAAIVAILGLGRHLAAAEAPPPGGPSAPPALAFVEVPEAQSGLTHAMNSDPKLGEVKWPWMSPLVDVNNDGHLDIQWYGHHGGGAGVWLGKGNGVFEFETTGYFSRWVFGGRDPLWWDANGDGFMDGIGTEHEPTGKLYLNDGTGHWKKTGVELLGVLTDLDGDGRHDDLLKQNKAYSVEPRPRDWAGKIPDKVALKELWDAEKLVGGVEGQDMKAHAVGFRTCHAADFDQDGRNELVLGFSGCKLKAAFSSAEYQQSWLFVREAAGWKEVAAARGLPAGPGHRFLPEDVDADGDLDLIDLCTGQWHANDGKGTFTVSDKRIFDPEKRKGKFPFDGDGEMELLDLDNNGYRDLVLSSDHTTSSGVFLNAGGGKFVEVPGIRINRRDRKFGDVDGDGDLDMVAQSADGKKMVLFRNETSNAGLFLKVTPKAPAEASLGCKIWVYRAGKLNEASALLHYRQIFLLNARTRGNVMENRIHLGLGQEQAVDIRVCFPSGEVRDLPGAKAKTVVEAKE